MQRRGVKILVLLALAWGIWWWVATGSMQSNINAWLAMQRQAGVEAEIGSMRRGGFPLQIATTVKDAHFIETDSASELHVPQATLSAPIYWPGDATLRLPAGLITLTTPQAVLTLTTDGIAAAMQLHPGTALELEALNGGASNVTLDLDKEGLLSVETVQANVQQDADPATYTIDLTATGLAFGKLVKDGLELPASWPDSFEPVVVDMTVTFDRPWDRSALQLSRPQPRIIKIEKAQAVYADLAVLIVADLTVDAHGTPEGTAGIRVKNWQQIFEMAVAGTEIPPEWSTMVEGVLTSMSDINGTLDLNVTLADGQMRMGFLPLGSTPRLIIP